MIFPSSASETPNFSLDRAYIDGKWVDAHERIEVLDPATTEAIGSVPNLGADAASAAVCAAHGALRPWQAVDARKRGELLRRWAELMRRNESDLARLLTREQGKPITEARAEVTYAAAFFDWFAEEGRRVEGSVLTPHQLDRRLLVRRQPVGVVGAVTPWNFPLAMIARKAAPALAVGCTIVVKPSELTPFSALALARLSETAGIPDGVFNVVTGDAERIGAVLTGDVRVRKFTFTGSTAVGKRLAAQCMSTVKRVSLELGGNAPFIVFDDADLEAAVDGALASKFRNSGQTCVCANRFLVQRGIYERFTELLSSRVSHMKVGSGLLDGVEQGPLIDHRAVDRVGRHVSDALSHGAQATTGGEKVQHRGSFYQPTVLRDVSPDSLIYTEETFGPVAAITPFDREADGIMLANHTAAGLAAYAYTRDLDRSWRVSEALDYGMVGLNTGLISTEVAPFGGIKESGLGREGSRLGVDDYLDTKLVCLAVQPERNSSLVEQ